jgi:hypothetical protein
MLCFPAQAGQLCHGISITREELEMLHRTRGFRFILIQAPCCLDTGISRSSPMYKAQRLQRLSELLNPHLFTPAVNFSTAIKSSHTLPLQTLFCRIYLSDTHNPALLQRLRSHSSATTIQSRCDASCCLCVRPTVSAALASTAVGSRRVNETVPVRRHHASRMSHSGMILFIVEHLKLGGLFSWQPRWVVERPFWYGREANR